jgi:4-amino-4-deoxy-L-arabinose transferase-like glycosyltransferase
MSDLKHLSSQSCIGGKYTPFLFVLGLFLLLISSEFLIEGMFLDGIIYAAVSRNLSLGIGDYWHLKLSETIFSQFYEHPPLVFWIQSFFFKIFGDSIYVERMYSLLTYVVSGFLIIKIWQKIGQKVQTGWIPLLFWSIISRVGWAVYSNMLENTLTIFILCSVFYYLKYKETDKKIWIQLAGFCLFLGFMCKGFVALFPLVMPFAFAFFIERKPIKVIKEIIMLVLVCILPFVIWWVSDPDFAQYFIHYWNIQVLKSFKEVQTVSNRFQILYWFLEELWVFIIPLLIILLKQKFRIKLNTEEKNYLIFFGILILCAILPLVLLLKQNRHYILPAYPFVGLFFATFVSKYAEEVKFNGKLKSAFCVLSISLFISSIFLNIINLHKTTRDKALLGDVIKITKITGFNKYISIPLTLKFDWSFHAYMARYANISSDSEKKYKFFVSDIENTAPANYHKQNIGTVKYHLYIK